MFFSPPFVWGLIGVLLIAFEMVIPGFTIFFFGAGALLTALVSAVVPPVASNIGSQLLLWAVSSVLSFAFLRRHFAKIFRGTVLNRSISNEGLGEVVTVLETISPDKQGRVRYRGTSWKAVSLTETFEPGNKAEIIEISGLTLTVTAPFEGIGRDEFLDRLEDPSSPKSGETTL